MISNYLESSQENWVRAVVFIILLSAELFGDEYSPGAECCKQIFMIVLL